MEKMVQPNSRLQNLVVARYQNGKTVKGVTYDFGPEKRGFHVTSTEGGKVSQVFFSELKAVFFVRSLAGSKDHSPPRKEFMEKEMEARGLVKVKITFFDGEVFLGTTNGYNPERKGFFISPLEQDSNNVRVYIITSAVKQIETWK